MNILNKALVGTAALAMAASSTFAINNTYGSMSGVVKVVTNVQPSKYDKIQLADSTTSYVDSLSLGTKTLSAPNYKAAFDVTAKNTSTTPLNTTGSYKLQAILTNADTSIASKIKIKITSTEPGKAGVVIFDNKSLVDLASQKSLPFSVGSTNTTKLSIELSAQPVYGPDDINPSSTTIIESTPFSLKLMPN